MANWEKLNKEFDDALKSMTDEKWDEFKTRIDKKREEKQALNLQNVSNNEALESSSDGVAVCDSNYDDFDTKDDLYAVGYDGDM